MKQLSARIAYPVLACAITVCGGSLFLQTRQARLREHFARAESFVQQKKGPEAEAEWQAIVQTDPQNIAARELLAEYYLSRGEWGRSAEAFKTLTQLAPNQPHVLCRQAAALLRSGDQKSAYEIAETELTHDRECVAALGLLTALMSQRPNVEPARLLAYERRLAHLLPNDVVAQRQLAETLTDQRLFDELRPVIATLLRLEPKDVQAYTLLGIADLARSDQPQGAQDALKNFETSLRLTPATQDNVGARLGRGRALLALGKPQEAEEDVRYAAERLSGVARVQQTYLQLCLRLGRADEARMIKARLQEIQRRDAEQRVLTVRCNVFPNDPQYPYRLGKLAMQQGDYSRALYYLDKARRLRPNDAAIAALHARASSLVQSGVVNGSAAL